MSAKHPFTNEVCNVTSEDNFNDKNINVKK